MIETSLNKTSTPSATIRTIAVPAAFVAAAGFAVEGVISLVHPTGDHHWDALSQMLNAAYAVAAAALIVALPALAGWLGVVRPIGRAGVIAAQLGCAAMVVESVVSGLHDGNTLGGLFFGGLLLTLAGLLTLGIAGLVAGQQRWAAALPVVALVIGIAGGEHGGSIVLAAVWVILGVALRRSTQGIIGNLR